MVRLLWNTFGVFLTKPKTVLSHDPFIAFLGVYPIHLKTHFQAKIMTVYSSHIQYVLNTVTRTPNWKQPKRRSVGEWINCCIQNIDPYSAINRDELSGHERTQRKVKGVSLSSRSPSEKATFCYASNYRIFWKRQNCGTQPGVWEEGGTDRWSRRRLGQGGDSV